MDETLEKQLCCIDVCKKASNIFFIVAAMICAAMAAADANPKTKMTAAKAAAAAAILFGLVGKWIHSLLSKHEAAIKKHKEITVLIIMGARLGTRGLSNISVAARRLQFQTKSKNMAAVEKSYGELLRSVENYSDEMKWVKQLVLQSIMRY